MARRSDQPFRHVPGLLYLTNNGVFSGSYRGMRFVMRPAEEQIRTVIWPEPWCLEKTPPEQTQEAMFPLTEEGLDQARAWLEEKYDQEFDRWEAVRRNHDL